MGVAKTLWDILDHRRSSEDIVDTRDPGTSSHFAGPRPLRWKVGVSAALVLGAGVLVIVVAVEPDRPCTHCLSGVFLGDLGEEPQRILLAREDFGSLDVVKVSHHGSRDQFEGLYQEIDATVGLIGVGEDNTYGHPTQSALDILSLAGTVPLRSDEKGIITLSPGGMVSSLSGARGRDCSLVWSGTKGAHMATAAASVVPWHGIRETPVILITGTESFLADRALRILTDRMKSSDAGVEINDLDAADYQQGDLLQLASPSLFGEPRLLRVQSVEKCNDAFLDDALSYLASPESDVVVVLRHGGGNRGKKLLDAIKASGAAALVVECKEIKKDAERTTFVQQEFQRHGVSIEPKAVRALVDAFSTDLAELASACSQLINDGGGQAITLATVERYYGGRVEATTFQIADQAISGHFAEALSLLRHAMNSGVEPVMVVAAFAMKLRTMALVGGSTGSIDAVASELGMAPWQVRNARSSLQGWDQAGLGAAILEVAHTDAAVKGSGPQPDYALERMVRVVALRGKAMSERAS